MAGKNRRAWNFTEAGVKRFARLFKNALTDQGYTYEKTVELFQSVEHYTNQSMIQRMRGGESDPPADFLYAVSVLEIIKKTDGTPYTLIDLIQICNGEYGFNAEELPGRSLPDLLQFAINLYPPTTNESSIEIFSKTVDIPVSRLKNFLAGNTIPELYEITEMARLIPNPDTGMLFDTLQLGLIAGTVTKQVTDKVVRIPSNLKELEENDIASAEAPGISPDLLARARAIKQKQEENPVQPKDLPPAPGRKGRRSTSRSNVPSTGRRKRKPTTDMPE